MQQQNRRPLARAVGVIAGLGLVAPIAALGAPGALAASGDPVIINHGAADVADAYNGLIPAPDGGTYNVGYQVVDGTNRAVLVTKSNADGSLDTSFGTDGRAVIDLVSSFHETITTNPGAKETAKGVAVDKLGRLLIVGEVEGDQSEAGTAVDTDIFVARLHPAGTLDRSYGTNGGWTRISLSDGVNPAGGAAVPDAAGWDIFVRPNQKAILSAAIGTDSEATRTGRDAAAVQLTSAGKLDKSFGEGGVASIETPFSDNLRRGLLDSDGSYFTTAYANVGSNNQPFIQKFTPAGKPDTSWGDDGLATAYPGGTGGFAEAYGMKKDADGNYIVSAYGYRGGRTGAAAGNSVDALLFSLKPNGSLNKSWADRGLVAYHVGEDGNNSGDRHRDHVILPDGRIVGVGGTSGTSNALITITAADGTPGTAEVLDFGGSDDYLWGITTIGDGYQVVAAGYGGGDAQLVTLDLSPVASQTELTLAKTSTTFGAANTGSIKVSAGDAPVSAKAVVTVDGKQPQTVQIGSSGIGSFSLPATLTAGKHTVEATVTPGAGVAGSKASATVTVAKASSKTTLSLPKSVKKSKQATATIKISGSGLPGGYAPTGKVTVYDGSKKLKTVTLSASAKGTVKVKLPKLKAKKHTIKVSYAGDSNLKSSKTSKKLKVTK